MSRETEGGAELPERACRCGQAGSSAGSSSSTSKASPALTPVVSWPQGGSARKRLAESMTAMSSNSASVNFPGPVFTYSTSSMSVCRFMSFSRALRAASVKSKVNEQRWSFFANSACRSATLTSRKAGNGSA